MDHRPTSSRAHLERRLAAFVAAGPWSGLRWARVASDEVVTCPAGIVVVDLLIP